MAIAHEVALSVKEIRDTGRQLKTGEIPKNYPLMLIYLKTQPRQPHHQQVKFLWISMCTHIIQLELKACPYALTSTVITRYIHHLLFFLFHVNTHFH